MIEVLNYRVTKEKLEELHTFESLYQNVLFKNNNLVIPYINLGISQHELNPSEKMKYIDFSYVVLVNIRYLDVYLEKTRYLVVGENTSGPKLHLGGIYGDYGHAIFNDMSVICESGFVHTLQNAHMSEEMWTVRSDPGGDPNFFLDQSKKEAFFSHQRMPLEVRELII